MRGMKMLALTCVIGFSGARRAMATVITLNASMDNSIFSEVANNSAGGAQAFFAGTNNVPAVRRGLIEFNVAGANAVPAGSTITNVQLTLYLAQAAGSGMGGTGSTPTVGLYRLTNSWGEGTAGSNTSGTAMIGQGVAATSGDATWSNRFYSANSPTPWTTAGGDFVSAPSTSLQIVGTTIGTAYTWPSTALSVSDVQSWLDNPSSNDGWLVRNPDETTKQNFRAFWSREAPLLNGVAVVPSLQITYTALPEPASLGLIAIGLASLIRRRRQAAQH